MTEKIQQYLDFSYQINDYLSALMLAKNLSCETYHYSHVWDEIQTNNVVIRPFPFSGVARERISGMIVKDEFETTIGYNQQMMEKRRNFTVSHEITHYLFHLTDDQPIFTDTRQSMHHSYSDELHEFQANIGASAILVPDLVLVRLLQAGWNLAQLSAHFGISESALYVRLIQTMQAYFEASYIAAKTTADTIRYKYYDKGQHTAKELGKNLEQRFWQTNRFIEAL